MKSHKTLVFLAAIIAILAALCFVFPKDGIKIGSITLRFPDLKKVLVREKLPGMDNLDPTEMARKEAELKGMADSVAYYCEWYYTDPYRFAMPNDDYTFFDSLFLQMESAKEQGRTIRIVHYGDSQIEGDRMDSHIRDYVHRTFGGGGAGMLPLDQDVASRSVVQWASGMITCQSTYGNGVGANGNYGPRMFCHRTAGTVNVGFKASKSKDTPESFKRFSTIKVLFNNRPGPLTVTLTDKEHNYSNTQSSSEGGVQLLEWTLDSVATDLHMTFQGQADVYGIMVDDGPGVTVDNVGLRGCSGQQFAMVNFDQLQASYSLMDVGMILFEYGINACPYIHNQNQLDNYLNQLRKQLDIIHEACPNAVVVFISPSDMTKSVNGERVTMPFMPNILEAMKEMSSEKKAAYWSLFDAMGGMNSMRGWVQQNLAAKDHIHFSNKGVGMIGDRFCEGFEKMREFYHFRQRCNKEQFHKLWEKERVKYVTEKPKEANTDSTSTNNDSL